MLRIIQIFSIRFIYSSGPILPLVAELILEQKIVIFSSHQMSYVEEFCEEIAIINKGEVVLSGNLKEIKKEFGKNRLILSASNYSLEALAQLCTSKLGDMVHICEVQRTFIVLELKEMCSKKDLLKQLLETDVDIEQFGDYEPTLTDIFVEKAGDQ